MKSYKKNIFYYESEKIKKNNKTFMTLVRIEWESGVYQESKYMQRFIHVSELCTIFFSPSSVLFNNPIVIFKPVPHFIIIFSFGIKLNWIETLTYVQEYLDDFRLDSKFILWLLLLLLSCRVESHVRPL